MNVLSQQVQGDVYVLGVSELPDVKLSPLSPEGLVVAIGETKGAKHIVVADRPSLVEVGKDEAGFFWLKIGEGAGAKLIHDTHGAIALPPAYYRIGGQREASPIEEYRKVRD